FDLWETNKAIERGLESRSLVVQNRRLIDQLEKANTELQQHEEILRRKVERATDRMATLYEAGKAMSLSLSLQSTCEVVVAQAARITGARASLLFLHDQASDDYSAEAAFGIGEERYKQLRFSMGIGYHGQVVQNAQPALVTDLTETVGVEDVLSALRANSAVIVPL